MINPAYLNTLQQVSNEYNVHLEDDEKVLFTAELTVFGDEKGQVIGTFGSKFTLTNKRIIADNGNGIWTIQIGEEVISWKKVLVPKRFFFRESAYFLVTLNHDVVFDSEKRTLGGFQFYFNKEKTKQLEVIVSQLDPS